MANFTNYPESKAATLMLETQQRDVGAKSAAASANGDGSLGDPPSQLINNGGGSGGGSRFHQHLPPSNHHHHYHPSLHHTQNGQAKDLTQQQQPSHPSYPQHLSSESSAESPGRKPSSTSLSQVEDCAASVTTSSGSGHVYAAVSVANSADVVDDIRKCGYLRKQKHGHKRFFVLRAASHLGPSRLEYYDSEKKFRSSLRSATAAAAAAAAGGAPSPPKRVIYLYQCFTVNKRADSKNKHLIALYTKDEYFAIVAENEQEQEDWYVAVSELMSEGKRGHVDADDLDDGYGTVTPGTVFKEVWQVTVKPKGLGQTRGLTGVYRLCLSSKTAHLVKLNCDTPCVNLQLMNIRRCGHSESFFFIEVGRSSSIGPGEIWMQVDDSVVAQSMHETILETMKALKAFAEFRPRSKSQSSGSNPVPFITTRRHLGNLPPSQTGLQRRSRTESVASGGGGGGGGTPPSSKSSGASGYRFRTSSEGEGTMGRPFRSATGSLVHLGAGRAHPGGGAGAGVATGNAGTSTGSSGGRYIRVAPPLSSCHARSASLPVSHVAMATSPVSVSSSSGHGSVSDTLTRPSSASLCGSPSDGGFNSSDEYGSSPGGDLRYFRVRSGTPDSLGNTPPIREEHGLSDYMAMGWHREPPPSSVSVAEGDGAAAEDERCYSSLRRRTHSLSRPAGGVAVYQKMTQTAFSLEEGEEGGPAFFGGGLLQQQQRGAGPPSSSSSSVRSDYSSCSEHSQQRGVGGAAPCPSPSPSHAVPEGDGGYMPMLCGVASPSPRRRCPPPDYVPMQPAGAGPSPHPPPPPITAEAHGYMMMLPGGGAGRCPSPSRSQEAEGEGEGEYMDMTASRGGCCALGSPYFSLPRSYKAPADRGNDDGDYVPMSAPAKPVYSQVATAMLMSTTAANNNNKTTAALLEQRGEGGRSGATPPHPPPPYGAPYIARPTRLPLGRRSLQGEGEGLPRRPPSPGEYINIEFGECSPTPVPQQQQQQQTPAVAPGDHQQDYMSVAVGGKSLVAPWNPPSYIRPLPPPGPVAQRGDYTDMTFNPVGPAPPPQPGPGEPRVVRADAQGRRRHSSETFAAPSGPPPPASPGAPNGVVYPRWSTSGSFDSVWMSVEGLGAPETPPSALPSSPSPASSSSVGRMCRNMSAGYQNGLNYIALELREDGGGGDVVDNGSGVVVAAGAAADSNGAYASIDFTKADHVTSSSKE